MRDLQGSGTPWLYSSIGPPCRCPYTLLVYARRKGWRQILSRQKDHKKIKLFESYGASPDLHCERLWTDEAAMVTGGQCTVQPLLVQYHGADAVSGSGNGD